MKSVFRLAPRRTGLSEGATQSRAAPGERKTYYCNLPDQRARPPSLLTSNSSLGARPFDQPIFQPSFVLHRVCVVLRFAVRLTVLS